MVKSAWKNIDLFHLFLTGRGHWGVRLVSIENSFCYQGLSWEQRPSSSQVSCLYYKLPVGWALLAIFNACVLPEYLSIFHFEHKKHKAFTGLHNVTGSSLILRFKLSSQCSWKGMRLLEKAVQAVNVRNFSLDTSVLSTLSPKTEHLLPLSCLCSQISVLVLKKTPQH